MADPQTPNIFDNAPEANSNNNANESIPDSNAQSKDSLNVIAQTPANQNSSEQNQAISKESSKNSATISNSLTPEQALFSIMAYLDILIFIPITAQPKNEFIKFHMRQGLAVTIFDFCLLIVASFLARLSGRLGDFVFLIFFILPYLGGHTFLIYQVIGAQMWKIPIIGDLIQKINLTKLNPNQINFPSANKVQTLPIQTTNNIPTQNTNQSTNDQQSAINNQQPPAQNK
ncbi:MAG: hypothetical protein UR28_C0017G0002 [Candidatus Peregrinibacteria bacterium GW2011_GWF2_33_10]|nr:MAG: hypothetical protein UR28_C0017G0002 [Candidatus Peregrinibacteria bacterium GW2011_GWF2_33_10]OGJ44557.1 MAG: hypothetical protein A2263_02490 [Candidatus Peregrinibacteria bacterium RIFOXYA2_FULL_33_21]OGJ44863.1 MAG: hypothetical protein A2272_01800 [Candidatus Peregrinibacteria bacterium RIFOXYA12_FULL_33_12]OGJ50056.1 MAG: hypothetical protein A2307_01490 [Candidatus Peregrinibacteria bacterium RIFOXYB2_FULL_33_20]